MNNVINKAITEFEVLSSFPQYDFDYVDLIKELKAFKDALEQPAQKPVAWYGIGDMYVWKRNLEENKDATLKVTNRPMANNENWKPLYTHPAPSWQGLSDDEIARLIVINEVDKSGDLGFARLIEQALRNKND